MAGHAWSSSLTLCGALGHVRLAERAREAGAAESPAAAVAGGALGSGAACGGWKLLPTSASRCSSCSSLGGFCCSSDGSCWRTASFSPSRQSWSLVTAAVLISEPAPLGSNGRVLPLAGCWRRSATTGGQCGCCSGGCCCSCCCCWSWPPRPLPPRPLPPPPSRLRCRGGRCPLPPRPLPRLPASFRSKATNVALKTSSQSLSFSSSSSSIDPDMALRGAHAVAPSARQEHELESKWLRNRCVRH